MIRSARSIRSVTTPSTPSRNSRVMSALIVHGPHVDFDPGRVHPGDTARRDDADAPPSLGNLHGIHVPQREPHAGGRAQGDSRECERHQHARGGCRNAREPADRRSPTAFTEGGDEHPPLGTAGADRGCGGRGGSGRLHVDVPPHLREGKECLLKSADPRTAPEVDPCELVCVHRVDSCPEPRNPGQVDVVTDDRHSVAARVHVGLDVGRSHLDRRGERREGVLRRLSREPAVGEGTWGSRGEVPRRDWVRPQEEYPRSRCRAARHPLRPRWAPSRSQGRSQCSGHSGPPWHRRCRGTRARRP